MIKDLFMDAPTVNLFSKTQPLQHQFEAFHRFIDQQYGAFFCEMGTGKTKIILDIMQNSAQHGALVAAPNGLHLNWFYSEIPKHWCEDIPVAIYCWKGRPTSKKDKDALEFFLARRDKFRFLLINVEALRTKNGYDTAFEFLKGLPSSHFVIDESTCIKNPQAQQTKACVKLGRMATRKWILNGTPMTQGPLDLYSQCKFLDDSSIPYKTWTSFKGTFAIEQLITLQNRSFRKVIGYQNLERLAREISPFALRLEKKDCLDLPNKVFTEFMVEPTKEQLKLYDEIKNLCLSEIADGKVVSVTIALTKLVKLHQVLTGFVKDDEGEVHQVPNNRLNALLRIAESDTSQSLVVFCAYRENVMQVTRALADTFGDESVVTYTGETSKDGRTSAVQRFQNGDAKYFVATSAAAKGLTLHKACNMVFYSNSYSLETRLQATDRIHRIGQTEKCTYVDLIIPNTLDRAILHALRTKKELSSAVLDDLKRMIVEA